MNKIRKKINKKTGRMSRKIAFYLFELRVLEMEDEKRNIIKSGTVVMSLVAAIIFAVFSISGSAKAVTPEEVFNNMVPGVWTEGVLAKINKRELFLPVRYGFTAENKDEDKDWFYGKLNVRVREYSLDEGKTIEEMPIVYEGPLNKMKINYLSGALEAIVGPTPTRLYYLQFQLDPSAGNELQGETINFSNIISRGISFN